MFIIYAFLATIRACTTLMTIFGRIICIFGSGRIPRVRLKPNLNKRGQTAIFINEHSIILLSPDAGFDDPVVVINAVEIVIKGDGSRLLPCAAYGRLYSVCKLYTKMRRIVYGVCCFFFFFFAKKAPVID